MFFLGPKSDWPDWAHYQLFKTYPHKRLKREGAKLVYWRPFAYGRPHPPRWVFCMHWESQNGDGGIVAEFIRKGQRWEMVGTGRLRHCHEPCRTVFKDKIEALKRSETCASNTT